jgi:hypothetical protein
MHYERALTAPTNQRLTQYKTIRSRLQMAYDGGPRQLESPFFFIVNDTRVLFSLIISLFKELKAI